MAGWKISFSLRWICEEWNWLALGDDEKSTIGCCKCTIELIARKKYTHPNGQLHNTINDSLLCCNYKSHTNTHTHPKYIDYCRRLIKSQFYSSDLTCWFAALHKLSTDREWMCVCVCKIYLIRIQFTMCHFWHECACARAQKKLTAFRVLSIQFTCFKEFNAYVIDLLCVCTEEEERKKFLLIPLVWFVYLWTGGLFCLSHSNKYAYLVFWVRVLSAFPCAHAHAHSH